MASRNRYYFDLNRTKEDEQQKGGAALQWLLQKMEDENHSDGIIASRTQNIADEVARGLGQDLVNKLTQTRHSVDTEYGSIHLMTNQIDLPIPPNRTEGPAIVVDPNEKLLDKVENDSMITDICVLNWPHSETTTEWIENYSARRIAIEK